MPDVVVIGLMVGLFAVLLLCGAYIHSILLAVGIVGLVLLDGPQILTGLVGPQPFGRTASYTLSTIPLFVLMAQFVLHTGVVRDLFSVVSRLSRGSRGVLGGLTLGGGAMLGAVSGSATASAASLGQVAVPELERRGFSPPFSGALAATAGSLSGIVPPSIILILFGVATETPIGNLFLGAVIPGLLVTGVYIVIMTFFLRRTTVDVAQLHDGAGDDDIGLRRAMVAVAVGAAIIVVVFGGIYSGTVTPTEAGAVGALVGFLAAVVLGRVNVAFLRTTLTETVKVTVMVLLILIGAQIFGRFMSLSQLPGRLIEFLGPLVDTPLLMMLILLVLFFVLFMFIEGAAVILMSVPVVLPILDAMETDLLWFGVLIAVVCTVGLITPPVGLSVFAVSGTSQIAAGSIFRYATIFAIVAAVVVSGLLLAFPATVTWLPEVVGS